MSGEERLVDAALANQAGQPLASPPPPHSEPSQQQPYPTFQEYQQPQGYAQPPQGYPQGGYASPPPVGYSQGGYPPQYPPPQYPPAGPYGQPGGEAVVVGVSYPDHHHHHHEDHQPIVEPFGEQLRRIPKHCLFAVIRPTPSNFSGLKRHASWAAVLFLLFIQVVWEIIFAAIQGAIFKAEVHTVPDPLSSQSIEVDYPSTGSLIGAAVMATVFFFFVVNGCLHVVSLCFGGGKHSGLPGSRLFLELCYVTLLFSVPFSLMKIVTLIPYLGAVIAFAIAVYTLVLLVISLMAVYGLTACQGVGVLIVYAILLVVMILILLFAFAFSFAAILSYLN